MFTENNEAAQQKMFTLENELDDRLKKKLSKHWSRLFYQEIFLGIDEEIFAPLYCPDNGRPNFPVNILVGMEILKEMHNLTDEQLFERYYFDISFRRALGLVDFNEYIIAEKTMYNFRAAVAEYDRANTTSLMEPVFQMLRDTIIDELGIKTGTQRTDSALIGANIKKMSRLMLFHKVLSNLARDMRALEISVPDDIEAVLKEDEDRYTYRLKRVEYEDATRKIGGFIYRLVTIHADDWRINSQQSFLNARRLLDEQCRISKKKKVLLKPSKEISSSSMQNPADPDATYRKKNNEAHRGYAVHGTETCDTDNKMQVVMDVDVVKNNVDDAKVLAENIKEYSEGNGLETMIADGGFVSDDVRTACLENDVAIITSAIKGKAPKTTEGKLTSKDFACDEQSGEIVSCPIGVRPRSASVKGSASFANFDPQKCSLCEKRYICPAIISEKQSRYVIDDKRRWLDDRHEAIKTGEYQKLSGLRPPVEGLMSQLKPKYLRGRIKFRGQIKVKSRMIMRAVAINFKRYQAYTLDIFRYFFRLIIQPGYNDKYFLFFAF